MLGHRRLIRDALMSVSMLGIPLAVNGAVAVGAPWGPSYPPLQTGIWRISTASEAPKQSVPRCFRFAHGWSVESLLLLALLIPGPWQGISKQI